MCLSCHKAHATENDGMLRFDYTAIKAGDTSSNFGCLACHTTKGILPENRL
jgi:predicted CXXCH cytochrome family protein